MRCIVQRSGPARVEIDGRINGAIDSGLVVLAAFAPTDTAKELEWMAHKLTHLRIFNDDQDKMNLSLQDVGGGILLISQFPRKSTRIARIIVWRPSRMRDSMILSFYECPKLRTIFK